jgi:hypothetical protein
MSQAFIDRRRRPTCRSLICTHFVAVSFAFGATTIPTDSDTFSSERWKVHHLGTSPNMIVAKHESTGHQEVAALGGWLVEDFVTFITPEIASFF